MCSFSGATGTSHVRHNADYVPYAKIRFDLRQRVASLTLNCNGDFAIRAYGNRQHAAHFMPHVTISLTNSSSTVFNKI